MLTCLAKMMVTWKGTRWVVSLEVCADECVFDVLISAEGHCGYLLWPLWWRYIVDIFLVWTHGEEKLLEFVDFLNSAHHSIKVTVENSKEVVNLLDVQVIKQGNKVVTDLYTKPTDTHHQLLHRSSCHSGHTKKGIPYGQALRIRRICSEDSFLKNDWETWRIFFWIGGTIGGNVGTA